jgi:tetratricopeptide (TPR) repeat protein
MILKPDITDGETITAPRTIKVRVQSDSLVTQVEFYVNDDLRDSATSTPYTFQLDPLAEKDGDEKLTFTAYNSDGVKASKSVNVHINSGAAKGAEANTQAAHDFLTQSKWDDAIYSARIALKATPDYVPAQLALARGFLGKGVYDKAQEFAEDALRNSPNNPEGLELLSVIELKRVFNVFAVSGGRDAVLNTTAEAIGKAIDSRRKVLDQQFDKLAMPSPGGELAYADTADRTQHYSAAISVLLAPFTNGGLKTACGDRLGYSQLRLGRLDDLMKTLALMKTAGTLDGYSYALWAVAAEYLSDTKTADDKIREAIEQAPNNIGVQTAQVYIALHRNNLPTMSGLANALAADQGQLPEVNFYLSVMDDRLNKHDDADTAYETTVLTEPLSFEMYVERGNEALQTIQTKAEKGEDRTYHEHVAEKMYAAARQAKPDSAEALTASAILQIIEDKLNDAGPMADAAVNAAPDYACAHYVAACYYSTLQAKLGASVDTIRQANRNGIDTETQAKIDTAKRQAADAGKKANTEIAAARKLDPKKLGGAEMPKVSEVFQYFYTSGGLPVITAPSVSQ